MKKILNIFYVVIFLFSFFTISNTKIAVLNIDDVLKNSYQYQNFIKKLNISFNKKYKIINSNIENIIKKEKKLINEINFLNYKKKFFIKYNLDLVKKNIYDDFRKLEISMNNKNIYINNLFMFKVKNIIKYLSIKYKYKLVIDSNLLHFFDDKNILDITKYVINELNS